MIIAKKKASLVSPELSLADEYLDQLRRMKADFENYKKRVERERMEFIKFANEELIMELLPILDNLERALNHTKVHKELTTFEQGIGLVKKDLEEILKKRGLFRLMVIGSPFDPNLHEAVMQKESEDYEDQTVIEELQAGYKLGERLLRPARVVISTKKNKDEKTNKEVE